MKDRHVIFLGAGASVKSGYPLANDLRLRLSGPEQLKAALAKIGQPSGFEVPGQLLGALQLHLELFRGTFDLFRNGGFGTVDEFSKLATAKYPEHVQKMKHLMRIALSLHNPEEAFEKSDYYPFIQRLYDDNLQTLKNNVTILSYNYDCYLDFLLLRAQWHRNLLGGIEDAGFHTRNRLTSGFFNPNDFSGITASTENFCHFKLHGSIAYAEANDHNRLFKDSVTERFKPFENKDGKYIAPPVVFPWELFDDAGGFIQHQHFIFAKQAQTHQEHSDAVILYNLYSTVWDSARKAVQAARKISFVGLSMHPYLQTGLKFLFQGKQGEVELVVANRGNERFKDKESMCLFHAGSPRHLVSEMLEKIAPDLRLTQSSSEFTPNMPAFEAKKQGFKSAITARNSFRDFIEWEMD